MKRRSINRWITRCFIVILLLSMIASAVANLREAYVSAIQRDTELMKVCTNNVINLLNHQWTPEAVFQMDEHVYPEAQRVLKGICEGYGLDYIVIYNLDPQTTSRYIYLGVSTEAETDEDLQRDYVRRTLPAGKFMRGEERLLEGSREIQHEVEQTAYGIVYTWLSPYWYEDGSLRAIIGMSYNIKNIADLTLHAFLVDIIPFAISLSLGLMILLMLVRRRIVLPINAISDSMKRFALESGTRPEPLNIPGGDEIGDIAAAYEKMTEDISGYVGNIEALTRERVEANVQLDMARRIQYGLVPKRTALKGRGYQVCAMTEPAKAVGGDFYDCFQQDEHSVYIVMGDVSGKGFTAAIFMAMIRTVIRQKLMAGLGPAETLNQTNDEIFTENPESLFVTAFAAVFDPQTGELRYANAGHNYPVLLKDTPEFLRPDEGIALGLFEDANLVEGTLTLPVGEGLLLYTDGVTEAVDPNDEFFGANRLLDAVKGDPNSGNTAEAVLLKLSRAVSAFCDGNEPFDDMAALALFRENASLEDGNAQPDRHVLPVSLAAFDTVRDIVTAVAGDTPHTRQALLACDEWISNVAAYSGATRFEFRCEAHGDDLVLTFRDDGVPFDPTSASGELADFDALDEGGMGLNLIRQSASEMRYVRQDDRNVLTLRFAIGMNRS